ncbi:nicotinamidase [Sulfobacillus thermotolerans]|uniref:nicotinamidase n=1 Tax=Sulfobacillus thermotolerans TaxID=338644 RepID=A0ABM6RPR3_9FIRM|nr:nicotinamidase [Sulfobacillus thermotolerans]
MGQNALIVVDFQNDFCSQGTLAVPNAETIIPSIQALLNYFSLQDQPIVLTKDFHPENHVSFQAQGGPWPPHCVQGTVGCQIHPSLTIPEGAAYFYKGFDPAVDAYSGFEGFLAESGHISSIGLATWLHRLDVETVYISGLATDYCVRATALDAVTEGFHTIAVTNAIKGVNVRPDDSAKALEDMRQKGVTLQPWTL